MDNCRTLERLEHLKNFGGNTRIAEKYPFDKFEVWFSKKFPATQLAEVDSETVQTERINYVYARYLS